MGKKSLTSELAAYWSACRYEDLPSDVTHAAKRFLLDTLAAGTAGIDTEETTAVLKGVSASVNGASGPAVVWGSRQKLPAVQAATVNGTSAHSRELDDFGGCGHSGAVVVPAICAVADSAGATGKNVIVAMAAGYDLSQRITDGSGGYQVPVDKGWHGTGTIGSIAASAGAARTMGLDAELFTMALGISGSFTGGIWAYAVDGAMTKRFHPGKAAETGTYAAFLAQAGLTGPRYLLEADYGGFYATYTGDLAKPEVTLDKLGVEFRILDSGIKPYASCRGVHAGVDAIFAIMEEGKFKPEAIEKVFVRCNAGNMRMVGSHRTDNLLDAQFSMPYGMAVAATSGRATLDQYIPIRRGEPMVDRLMDRTELVIDSSLKPRENAIVEVTLADGRQFKHQTPFAKGAPQNPVTDQELKDKAETLIVPVLGSARYREIVDTVWNLEKLADFRSLTRMLQPS